MVASSPVRHESNVQPNQVEVQAYQPPWKALSEFAMQSELDQPPFQQLVSSFQAPAHHLLQPLHHPEEISEYPEPADLTPTDDDADSSDAVVFT